MSPLRLLKHKFVRDSAILQVGGLLNAAGNLLASVGVAHLIGPADQGDYFSAVAAYTLFFFVLNLGAVPATVSQVASASARGLSEKTANWLGFLTKVYLLAGLILVASGWLILPWTADRLWGQSEIGWWAWWLCFTPLVEMPRVVAGAAFQGTRRMLPLAQSENGLEVCRVFLVVSGALITGDATGPVLGTLASSALGSILSIDLYRRARRDGGADLPGVREIVLRARAVPLREGLPLGLRLGLMRTIDALAFDVVPPLLIKTFGSSEWVSYFRIAKSIMKMPLMFMQGMSRTALPALSELAGIKDLARFRRIFTRTTLLGGGLIAIGVFLCLPLVPVLTRIFYPPEYHAPVFTLAAILSIGYAIQAFSVAIDSFYIVTDRLSVAIRIGAIGFVVTVALSAWLAAELPRTGAAWGTTASLGWCALNYAYIFWYFRGLDAAVPPTAPGEARA